MYNDIFDLNQFLANIAPLSPISTLIIMFVKRIAWNINIAKATILGNLLTRMPLLDHLQTIQTLLLLPVAFFLMFLNHKFLELFLTVVAGLENVGFAVGGQFGFQEHFRAGGTFQHVPDAVGLVKGVFGGGDQFATVRTHLLFDFHYTFKNLNYYFILLRTL
jgi:hypothetical protein